MPDVPAAIRRSALVGLLLMAAGCGWLRPAPTPILPAGELYKLGEQALDKPQYNEAREHFKKIVERHPNAAYPSPGRLLIGAALHRESAVDKATQDVPEFL